MSRWRRGPRPWLLSLAIVAAGLNGGCGPGQAPQPVQSSASAPLTGTVSIKVDGDQPGWGELTLPSTYSGFDVDMSRWIADRHKFQPSLSVIATADREQELMKSDGKMLVIATYSITDKRRQKVGMAGPYIKTQQGVMVRAGDTSIGNVADLKGKHVCTAEGTTSESQLNHIGATVTTRAGFGECIEELRKGLGVQAVSTDLLILHGFANKHSELHVVENLAFGASEQYGIGFKKGDIATCQVLTALIKDFIISGTWDVYYTNYRFPESLRATSRPDPALLDSCDSP